MKQGFVFVVIGFLFAGMSYGLWYFWDSDRQTKKTLSAQEKALTETEDKYNKAMVVVTDKITHIEFLDKELEKENGKKGVVEKVYIYVESKTEGSGDLKPVSDSTGSVTSFTYDDFRLHANIFPEKRQLRYTLTQRIAANLYVWPDNDYRIEIAELDDQGNVVQVFSPEKFIVTKTRPKNTKFMFGPTISFGGGGYVGLDTKGDYSIHAILHFIHHGYSKVDANWRLLGVGVGYPGVVVNPISYRIGNHIPLFEDIFLDVSGMMTYKGKLNFGLGLSTTL